MPTTSTAVETAAPFVGAVIATCGGVASPGAATPMLKLWLVACPAGSRTVRTTGKSPLAPAGTSQVTVPAASTDMPAGPATIHVSDDAGSSASFAVAAYVSVAPAAPTNEGVDVISGAALPAFTVSSKVCVK